MKILFAIQATGNGHISRAREVIPHLQHYGKLDLLLSGIQADVGLLHPIAYHVYGTSFIFGKKGGVDIRATLKSARFGRLVKDIRSFPIQDYDLIINDFEPVTAWACRLRGQPCYGLSHQGAFLSPRTPRPARKVWWAEALMKYYSPLDDLLAFHFDRYDHFIRTPIIRSPVRQAQVSEQDHVAIYLPALDHATLAQYLRQIKAVRWKIFSKHTRTAATLDNVTIMPISDAGWIEAAASACGVLIGSGFEGPAEALHLGKKILTVPMFNQYEQLCNAAAMEQMGIKVLWKINPATFVDELRDWLHNVPAIQVTYPDETAQVVKMLFDKVR